MSLQDAYARSPTSLVPADTVARVDAALEAAERSDNVSILHAIESGSRAWGFPSPDSDFDCRFFYLRTLDAYLSLHPFRDVIERPIKDDLDVNGWDLVKALRLLLRGNAVAIEWLRSPIVYRSVPGFASELLSVAGEIADWDGIARHYHYFTRQQKDRHLGRGEDIQLKKVFYMLRPAVALRWMQMHGSGVFPPMALPQLCSETDLPQDLLSAIGDLIERKAVTREMGTGQVPSPIRNFIEAEAAFALPRAASVAPEEQRLARANEFFRRTLAGHDMTAMDLIASV